MKSNKAITLISLVITIIVLLILAGVTINGLISDNGILDKAAQAKIATIIQGLKEEIHLKISEDYIQGKETTVESLLADKKIRRTVVQQGEIYYLRYALKEDAFSTMSGLGKGTEKDVFVIDDDFNIKYIDSNENEYGDNLNEKILEDETIIRFANDKFGEYISKIIGTEQENVKFGWMKTQTSLTISDVSVTSLEDLVFFPNLKTLNLGSWSLSDNNKMNFETLDGLKMCTNLQTLIAIRTNITDVKGIRGCENLTTINFSACSIGDFSDISFCNKLNSLTVYNVTCDLDNLIDSIKHIETIKSLKLNYLRLTSMEFFESLKANLESISLAQNKITQIEGLEKFTNLKSINLDSNNIEDITPLAKNENLKFISLLKNTAIDENRENYTGERLEALEKISKVLDLDDGVINLDANKLKLFTNYKKLTLTGQKLENLDYLEGITGLVELNIGNNNLTLLTEKDQEILKSMQNLQILQLNTNDVQNISFVNELPNLKTIYINGNPNLNIQQIEDKISSLKIRFSDESFTGLASCDPSKITKIISTGWCGLTVAVPDLSNFTNLHELNLMADPKISDFSNISKITSLVSLNLQANELKGRLDEIDFSGLTNLKTLNLSQNYLTTEDLENLRGLKNNLNMTINLSNNSIIDASALLVLDPSTKINLKGNVNLSQESKDALIERFGSNVSY